MGASHFQSRNLAAGEAYGVKVKAVVGGREGEWSDEVEVTEKRGAKIGTCKPSVSGESKEEREKAERMLNERIEAHDENRRAAQDKLRELCEGLRVQVAGLKIKVNKELEEKFTAEDRRLQTLLSGLRSGDGSNALEVLQRAKAELLVV